MTKITLSEIKAHNAQVAAPAGYIDQTAVQWIQSHQGSYASASIYPNEVKGTVPFWLEAPAAPVAQGEPLPGWKFNHARRHPDPDQDGAWEIGFLDDEDDRFSPIITVDTGLYFQDDQAEPLARAILAKLAAPAAPVAQPLAPRGFLLHWPKPGGGRELIWSEKDGAGVMIGCPVEPVFSYGVRASGTDQEGGV